ncbi:hypothetical protein [Bacillus sp. S14(2024)]|uniref:hypothetical protein n=1 Tax=Bacillus sp. S14(2024) TaxID=3162884 RepID=UPI003D1A73EC
MECSENFKTMFTSTTYSSFVYMIFWDKVKLPAVGGFPHCWLVEPIGRLRAVIPHSMLIGYMDYCPLMRDKGGIYDGGIISYIQHRILFVTMWNDWILCIRFLRNLPPWQVLFLRVRQYIGESEKFIGASTEYKVKLPSVTFFH